MSTWYTSSYYFLIFYNCLSLSVLLSCITSNMGWFSIDFWSKSTYYSSVNPFHCEYSVLELTFNDTITIHLSLVLCLSVCRLLLVSLLLAKLCLWWSMKIILYSAKKSYFQHFSFEISIGGFYWLLSQNSGINIYKLSIMQTFVFLVDHMLPSVFSKQLNQQNSPLHHGAIFFFEGWKKKG